ncbi:MAG: hypothetical protein AAGA54_32930 [Myxococcota bacterium]
MGRRVLVVAPRELDGARRLADVGARWVSVAETRFKSEEGIACSTGWPTSSEPFDMVILVDAYASSTAAVRNLWLERAASVLAPDGWIAAWAPHDPTCEVDFWTLEEELGARFDHVYMLAQLPWQGVSLAPVLADANAVPQLSLDESLLCEPPDASHYLALGTPSPPTEAALALLTGRCLLIPSPQAPMTPAVDPAALAELQGAVADAQSVSRARAERVASLERELKRKGDAVEQAHQRTRAQAQEHQRALAQTAAQLETRAKQKVQALESELATARDEARKASTDLSILTRSVQDLEAAVARANDATAQRQSELNARDAELAQVRAHVESLDAERGSLSRQMEVALAEREGARQLSERVEAELELTRRRLGQHETSLAERVREVSKLTTDVEVTRAELEHHRSMLARAQSREEELSASAAQGAEQGRMLAEVAADRDRLREELGRRSQQIQRLEERLWSSREELEKARLDNVRLAGDAERLRDRAERAHQSEQTQAQELQRLSGELHGLELTRAELSATVRAHEDEIGRLRAQTEAHAGDTQEMASLRSELADRSRDLAEAKARQEQNAAREREAASLAKKRERQLSQAGEELERLRKSAEQNAAAAIGLESELEVKSLEVEQLAASVSDLQGELDARRTRLDDASTREEEMRRQLERSRGEQESLRRRLREREQELEDISSANESSGVELYKLRRELEAAAQANEQLEQALDLGPNVESSDGVTVDSDWPDPAVEAVRRLKAQLAAQSRRHAEQLAARSREASSGQPTDKRVAALRLEVEIRAEEQEHMLRQLDTAEQRIWEMTDAADRNAARLAASLAQLEKHKEELDETRDELEVARKLLEAAEARALEQERLLASERAKLARVGAEKSADASPPSFDQGIDELFADLDGNGDGPKMVELEGPSAASPVRPLHPPDSPGVPTAVADPSSSKRHITAELPRAPRMVVEAIEDEGGEDDPWSKGVISAPSRATPRAAPDAETQPRARMPQRPKKA